MRSHTHVGQQERVDRSAEVRPRNAWYTVTTGNAAARTPPWLNALGDRVHQFVLLLVVLVEQQVQLVEGRSRHGPRTSSAASRVLAWSSNRGRVITCF
jgi:hypothetical protein